MTTTIQTHEAQNVKISKNNYTNDKSMGREKSVEIKIESENDNTDIIVHGGKDLSLEVTE